MSAYTELHLHTSFSFLDGASQPEELIGRAVDLGFDALAITVEHAIAAGSLASPHRDPFDRMLIAQAMIEKMAMVTSDSEFAQFDVKIIW